MNALVRNFLAADRFAVVGASQNRTKFGNKVRCIVRPKGMYVYNMRMQIAAGTGIPRRRDRHASGYTGTPLLSHRENKVAWGYMRQIFARARQLRGTAVITSISSTIQQYSTSSKICACFPPPWEGFYVFTPY